MEHVRMQMFIRYDPKQCINSYQIHSWSINAVLMTFEAKKSIHLISNSGCPNLHALKINKQYSQMSVTVSVVYTDVVVLYKPNIFQSPSFLIKIYDILKNFHIILLDFRRKWTYLALCKLIESAIQWFQMHHRITFVTIPNLAEYLSGARFSIFPPLVPRLCACLLQDGEFIYFPCCNFF